MAFRSSNGQLGSVGGTVTINSPTGVALNDIIILAVDENGSNAPTWPSGFSATFATCTTSGAAGLATTYAAAWKLATGSEPSTYTVTNGSSSNLKCWVGCWSGRASTPGTPVATNEANHTGSPGTQTFVLTGYTAAAGDDVCVLSGVASGNTAGSFAITNAIGYTSQQDVNATGSFIGGDLNLSTVNNLAAGATGTLTFTATGTGTTGFGADTCGVVIPLPSGTSPNSASIAWVT